MRRNRDEVRFQLVELHHLIVEPRTLDRERDPVGDQLQQLDIVAGEPAVDERPDMDHAKRLVGDHQRHSEHRLDPLFAQNRVEHVRVIDVIEDHRPPLGGDPAGEAAADRNTHAALDLLLDPDRSACNQLLGGLVDEEHRARVSVEDVADTREKHREQRRRAREAQGPHP